MLAVDSERLEHPLEWDARLFADGADVRLEALEETEDGLIGHDEDRALEPELATLASKLGSRRLGALRGGGELLFADARPVALDQVAPRFVASGHANDATPPRSKRNRVFP